MSMCTHYSANNYYVGYMSMCTHYSANNYYVGYVHVHTILSQQLSCRICPYAHNTQPTPTMSMYRPFLTSSILSTLPLLLCTLCQIPLQLVFMVPCMSSPLMTFTLSDSVYQYTQLANLTILKANAFVKSYVCIDNDYHIAYKPNTAATKYNQHALQFTYSGLEYLKKTSQRAQFFHTPEGL
jgi:hypothetical protein